MCANLHIRRNLSETWVCLSCRRDLGLLSHPADRRTNSINHKNNKNKKGKKKYNKYINTYTQQAEFNEVT